MSGDHEPIPSALAPTEGNPRFPLIDGVRAIAALSVLTFHAAFYSSALSGTSFPASLLAHLNVGVALFFVISGFLLYRPMVAARLGHAPPARVRDYARRRSLRIVPAYWVALTLLAIYPGLRGVFTGDWWVYYGFAQDYGHGRIVNGIGPAWTLGCEVVYYALLPAASFALDRLARLVGRRVSWPLELVALTLVAALGAFYFSRTIADPSLPGAPFAATLAWFALGMAVAVVSALSFGRRNRALLAIERFSWVGWPVAVIAYIAICRGPGLNGAALFFQRASPTSSVAVQILSALVAFGVILPAAFVPPGRGKRIAAERVLGSRPLAWLGLVSYGVYLYHEPIARKLNGGLSTGAHSWGRFAALLAGTAALAIAAGAASFYVVEKPLLRLARLRSSRRRAGRTPLAGGHRSH